MYNLKNVVVFYKIVYWSVFIRYWFMFLFMVIMFMFMYVGGDLTNFSVCKKTGKEISLMIAVSI